MLRVHRWACQEKRRTLEDLIRLAEKLRADRGRIGPPDAIDLSDSGKAINLRIEKLDRTIADIDTAIDRARDELAAVEREFAQVQQMAGGQSVESLGRNSKQRRGSAALRRDRRR
ncbi:MAG: hypothetical protein ACREEE_00620 [Dongiaceae bacterium]